MALRRPPCILAPMRPARGSYVALGAARRGGEADAEGPSFANASCPRCLAPTMRHAFSSAAMAAAASAPLQAGPACRSASAAAAAAVRLSHVIPKSVTCSHRASAITSAKNAAGGARPPKRKRLRRMGHACKKQTPHLPVRTVEVERELVQVRVVQYRRQYRPEGATARARFASDAWMHRRALPRRQVSPLLRRHELP